jgi:hypothetical protein
MFGDVKVTKDVLRWRTALIVRELEEEIAAAESFKDRETRLAVLMDEKEVLEGKLCQLKLGIQRKHHTYGPEPKQSLQELNAQLATVRHGLDQLDTQIGPLAKASGELNNPIWGLLLRTGNDKSHLAFQMERYADIYSSRVSNFLLSTPFVYFRSHRGSLPHDPALPGGKPHTAAPEER